jgi:Lamin Tail Domain
VVYINEWFPNPVGSDAAGEFVELFNGGTATVRLDGWALGTGAKRRFGLGGHAIAPGEYLAFAHAETKLSLKNTDGEVLLYGPDGRVVDAAQFAGAAPEGRSYSRVDYGTAPVAHFAFTYPTPGAANRTIDTSVSVREYPRGVPLTPRIGTGSFTLLAASVAAALLTLFIYVIRKNKNISDLLFGGDEGAGI